jgi:hypothetical protein
MGILAEPLADLRALKLPHGFRVAELGDQWVTATKPHRLAATWYREELHCGTYVSIDGNGRGTHRWDLNRPLPMGILSLGRFDLVTDFGTGEHIFDQAQVWRTLHDLCVVGGYIAFDRPAQGYPTHGYYCIDPCLLKDLVRVNQYRVVTSGVRKTSRGVLRRGIWQKLSADPFVIPQQGRYLPSLKI